MKTKKWSHLKAAGIGLTVGLSYSIFNVLSSPDYSGASGAYLTGMVFGDAIGGAFLFALVAAIRNIFVK